MKDYIILYKIRNIQNDAFTLWEQAENIWSYSNIHISIPMSSTINETYDVFAEDSM